MQSDGSFSIGSGVWPGTSKVIEEMGEALQVLGKLIATQGDTIHWDGSNLDVRLIEELGDVLAAVKFFVQANKLDVEQLNTRTEAKLLQFWTWQYEQ